MWPGTPPAIRTRPPLIFLPEGELEEIPYWGCWGPSCRNGLPGATVQLVSHPEQFCEKCRREETRLLTTPRQRIRSPAPDQDDETGADSGPKSPAPPRRAAPPRQ